MTKEEAKREFKLLRKAKLISKPYWDKAIDCADIACLACTKTNHNVLSNPFFGKVYILQNAQQSNENINGDYFFRYKGTTYKKISNKISNKFITKEQYKEVFPTFDEIFAVDLTQKELDSDYNIVGGAYRRKESEEIFSKNNYTKEELENLEKEGKIEKVITTGRLTPFPPNAEDCPICKMLYEISKSDFIWEGCFFYLRENIIKKWWEIKRYIYALKRRS